MWTIIKTIFIIIIGVIILSVWHVRQTPVTTDTLKASLSSETVSNVTTFIENHVSTAITALLSKVHLNVELK